LVSVQRNSPVIFFPLQEWAQSVGTGGFTVRIANPIPGGGVVNWVAIGT
jgi:hypothetical protein